MSDKYHQAAGFNPHLRVTLQTSAKLRHCLVIGYTLTTGLWLTLPVEAELKLAGSVLLLALAVRQICHGHCASNDQWPVQLQCLQHKNWRLYDPHGGYEDCLLESPAFITPWLLALTFRPASGRPLRLLVLDDMLPPAQFRQLRVRLLQSVHGHRDRAKIPGRQ